MGQRSAMWNPASVLEQREDVSGNADEIQSLQFVVLYQH